MKRTVFYSWQSDLPNATNRSFIETALEKAASAIAADDSIEVEPVIDRDTQGVPGSPDISATIFKKIDEADVYVADVSIIGQLTNGRPMPNPNVLIELGYAIKALEYSRVILVFNLAYGAITDLPFDLRTKRIMTYYMPLEAAERADERKKLTAVLREAIQATVSIDKPQPQITPLFEVSIGAIENQQGNKLIKLRQELKTFLTQLDTKQPVKLSQGGTVEALIEGLQKLTEEIAIFSRLCQMVGMMNDADAALEIQNWFGHIIERYDLPSGYQGRVHDYDFDYYKFLGHELYTVLIASLLNEERWRIVQKLFSEWIPVAFMRPNHGPMTATFKDISHFIGSLYYESEKRHKLSLQANLLKEHFENDTVSGILSFNDFMAADLFMYLVVELPEEKQTQFWQWRPISFLFLRSEPAFLMKARRKGYADFLAETCGIKGVSVFKERMLMRLPKINNLFAGNLHHWPIKNESIENIGSAP